MAYPPTTTKGVMWTRLRSSNSDFAALPFPLPTHKLPFHSSWRGIRLWRMVKANCPTEAVIAGSL